MMKKIRAYIEPHVFLNLVGDLKNIGLIERGDFIDIELITSTDGLSEKKRIEFYGILPSEYGGPVEKAVKIIESYDPIDVEKTPGRNAMNQALPMITHYICDHLRHCESKIQTGVPIRPKVRWAKRRPARKKSVPIARNTWEIGESIARREQKSKEMARIPPGLANFYGRKGL